jgi:dCTP deaminase
MSLLSYNQLMKLVRSGVIDAPLENINGASIDVTLGDKILVEQYPNVRNKVVDLKAKRSPQMKEVNLLPSGYIIHSGDFILATTNETFNLPSNVAAEYKLKSSLARSGLQHMLAGWCDPSWSNSKLTLEFQNVTSFHSLLIKPGMKIGQIVFFLCEDVPDEHSYATRGQYNNQTTVTGNKGVR